jgi:enoyl-[acyl-carrier protein] reductase II
MVNTSICKLLGIEYPIIQAGMGPFTSAELVAAVSNAGALGSLGAGGRPIDSLRKQVARLHELTKRPFAINHTLSPSLPDPEAFRITLEAKPTLISFALGNPRDYVQQVHDEGILAMQQVSTVKQAYQAAENGADIVIAQGSEAGGFGGMIAEMALLPQVVDAIQPVPVVAAGGIADGRGLAAALILGAQGANIGTRFLATLEAPISMEWKQAILAADSQDAIKVEAWNDIFPPVDEAYRTIPRTLSSTFVERLSNESGTVKVQAELLRSEISSSIANGKFGELFPFTGQIAGLIKEILPAAEIVGRIAREAEEAIERIGRLVE